MTVLHFESFMFPDLPSEGTRLSLSGYLGTVRFIGNVHNTTGVWLGIEWDDPDRGKHDGVKGGKRYFTCRVHDAGSFIRPSANISYGKSFLDALVSKYIEVPHGSGSQEKVLLGSSNGAIEVEAVRLDKIRGKLSNLERLREVSLDSEDVAKCDPPGTIRNTCPSVRGLDLSMSLLPNWDLVALIAVELPALRRLALNRNRFKPATNLTVMSTAFQGLTDLQLNGTMTSWQEMQRVTAMMPNLRLVEMGYNRLERLCDPDNPANNNNTIQTINLDTNECRDWVHLCRTLEQYSSLQRVIMSSNQIEGIPPPEINQQSLHGLKHLSLSFNRLNAWSDVDALSIWCPDLQTLTLSANPLLIDHELGRHSRPFTIARIPSLVILDGAAITLKERNDCELFYLSYVMRHGPGSEGQRSHEHPRWRDLCNKHGRPDEVTKGKDQDKLSGRLIEVVLYQSFSPPENDATFTSSKPMPLRVLPTMTLRTFRLRVCKAMKCSASETAVTLWLRMDDGLLVELDGDRDLQNLGWVGLENGSEIVFHIRAK